MKSYIYFTILAVCACIFSSCASGPLYHDVKASLNPQAGKGLVLVYYEAGFAGSAANWHIYSGDKLLTDRFKRGSFYSYQADPGDLRLSTTHSMTYVPVGLGLGALGLIPKDQQPIRIEPNQTYYITMGFGMWRERLYQVPEEKAAADIKDCHWINPP